MFGTEQNYYFQELNIFKKNLLNLYQRRVKLTAERETLRWKYVTQLRAEWNNLASQIYDQAFKKSPEVVELCRNMIGMIQGFIPMVKVDGAHEMGWGTLPNFGGPLNISFLSPTAHLIIDPFWKNSPEQIQIDPRPFYQMYPGLDSRTLNLLETWFLGDNSARYISERGGNVKISIPLEYDWMNDTNGFGENKRLSGYFDEASAIVFAEYNGRSIAGLVATMRDTLAKIFDLGDIAISVQIEIDTVEKNLKEYVSEYAAQFGDALNASDILRDLQAAAEGDIEAIKRLGLYEAPVESTVLPEALPEPVIVQPKSKLPWILAGAAAIFLATRE